MSVHQLYNKYGLMRCNRVGCKKTVHLINGHGGWFCHLHLKELNEIHAHIEKFKLEGNTFAEEEYRKKEVMIKKLIDVEHYRWLSAFESKEMLEKPLPIYNLRNRNGHIMCHAVGCRKHVRLVYAHNGWFCSLHLEQLNEIRAHIDQAKLVNDTQLEFEYRQRELVFRKKFDAGHYKRLAILHSEK